ncbi:hypothetical protein LTR91_015513 [Friedmanniomyces endolithicus]|uniref:SMODS and SLOG-associating 2TM effector domain-containing protein n=1 Tax=Friedmanniomyces endolithicus TaxID=329885 RepID=A0AAN6QLN2_9PEZI|nr:hypothetical protein LTR57_007480 [Friedmanniomyces endolithicus]KAK0971442.1 hypothetical protein LTR91_015513 [Friedmanniomyces endolithicus]KAK0972491.1 hypothetical protein LTS01_014953 [Friedmanniomyces endolithicus]KAK1026892.1 hypothetical protein LTS16_021944 [Friedmanniomyces endolithicus]
MHELPEKLTNSVRSWRASIYGASGHDNRSSDVEKGHEDYGDKDFERALNPTQSSVVLVRQDLPDKDHTTALLTPTQHPTKSRRALNQPQQDNQAHQLQHHASQDHREEHLLPAPNLDDPDPAAARLDNDTTPLAPADFYELMGMRPPISKQQNPKELAIRHGLYARIQSLFSHTQTKYRIFDVLTYVLLALQLVLSAVFIVLGSLTRVDSHVAIAVLGAVSTVVAGSLALMKGQGLPNRLRQTRDGLRNVMFEAEELYWDVGADRAVFYKDVKKIREDFLRVTEEARRNHPDTWNSSATQVAAGVKSGSAGQRATSAPGAFPKL